MKKEDNYQSINDNKVIKVIHCKRFDLTNKDHDNLVKSLDRFKLIRLTSKI